MASSRALATILPLIAPDPYQAHQKARTFIARYVHAKKWDAAVDVCFQSARELLKGGHQGSGTDLATYLVDVYDEAGVKVTNESRDRLTQLIALVGPGGTWRKTIIEKSVGWTAMAGEYPAGDPDLHHYVGELLYKEGAFNLAEPHFLAAGTRDSARCLAEMMVQWCGNDNEPGPFALHGTIPYLRDLNILAAYTFITQFTSRLLTARPSLSVSLPTPLSPPAATFSPAHISTTTDSYVNFCQLAVLICQRSPEGPVGGSSPGGHKALQEAWVRLRGTYASRAKGALLSQKEVKQSLDDIADAYLGIPPPRGAVNPLKEMLSSFMGGPAGGSGGRARKVLPPASMELD